jgi:hypothetical protein
MDRKLELMAVLSKSLIAGRTLEKYMFQGKCPQDSDLQELVDVRFQIHSLLDHLNRSSQVTGKNDIEQVSRVVESG